MRTSGLRVAARISRRAAALRGVSLRAATALLASVLALAAADMAPVLAGDADATDPSSAAQVGSGPDEALGRQADGAGVPANTKCPVLVDEDVDPGISAEYRGKRVYFCCPKCRRLFLESPEKYLVNLQGFAQAASIPSAPAAPAARLSTPMRLLRWIGRFHPVVIHFPIALILVACAAELLGWLMRSRRLLDAARLSLATGALGAAVAAGLGWAAWLFASFPGELAPVLSTHRWLGTATAIVSVLAAAAGATGGEWESPRHRAVYRLLLLASALLVGAAGHWGGTLIYGTGHYAW